MARHSLYVLKVPSNTKQTNKASCLDCSVHLRIAGYTRTRCATYSSWPSDGRPRRHRTGRAADQLVKATGDCDVMHGW